MCDRLIAQVSREALVPEKECTLGSEHSERPTPAPAANVPIAASLCWLLVISTSPQLGPC